MLGPVDRVCPLLALAADRRTAVDGVDGGHRCHALEPPVALERDRQSRLCLTPGHQRCERYLARIGRGTAPVPGSVAIGDGLRSTRLLVTPEPAWRGMAGRARRSSRRLAVVAIVLAVALTGAAFVAANVTIPDDLVTASPTAGQAASSVPSERATPQPSVVASASPMTTPSPVATAVPTATVVPATPAPTPEPTAQRTYVVQAGDTLAAIAQQFGSTVAAIQAANGIEDADQIVVGQVLVIP